MEIDEYQKMAKVSAEYPNAGSNYIYPVLGLAGEAGEVCEKIKKLQRDEGSNITEKFKKDLTLELGDVLWYVSQIAGEFGIPLEEVALENIAKLRSRKKRGVLRGNGDNR